MDIAQTLPAFTVNSYFLANQILSVYTYMHINSKHIYVVQEWTTD